MLNSFFKRIILVLTGCYFVSVAAQIDKIAIAEEHFVQVYQVGTFVDSKSCYEAVVASDEDADGRVTREEYVSLARELSPPGLIENNVAFNDLPLAFTNTFRHLACLCQIESYGGDSSDTQCCVGSNAHIRVPDSPDGDGGTPEDVAYLYAVCSLTKEAANSILTSPFPTASPSTSPAGTLAPTLLPTSPPTPGLVDTPSVSPVEIDATPSSTPTSEPTRPPVPTVSPAPTAVPTAVAAPAPTATPQAITYEASVMYSIAVSSGQILIDNQDFEQQYLQDLTAAMNQLALQVGDETLDRRLRALQSGMSVVLPTEISSQEDIECPADLTVDGDLCQDIVALVNLSMPPGTDANSEEVNESISRYESNLLDAIINGDLQSELLKIRVDTPVKILTGVQPGGDADGESESLSTGARAGIAVSIAFVVALIGIGLLVSRRKPQKESRKIDYAAYDGEEGSADALPSAKPEGSVNDSLFTDDAVQIATDTGAAVTLGAAEADYGKHSRRSIEAMEAGEDHLAEPGADQYDEGSSNAGSSGWSSSAGLSSLNTGSMDDSMDAAAAAGATLAALGVASGLARRGRKKESSALSQIPDSGGDIPVTSREELDRLIEAGDWAAVGATAALLAAASDSQSLSSARSRTTDRSSAGSGSIDAARAAELDQLVDAGDWEGVVLAAAKYQTEESSNIEGTAGASVESSGDSMTGTGTGTGASPSMSTSVSDSPSKIAKRAEIRAEVEALVRRVVPEEIDNVDEMMNQFKGREEELIETLRTMQERAAAQKARAASQKAAKVKAKQTVQRGVVPGAQAAAQKIGSPKPMPSTPDGSDMSSFVSPESIKEHRSALELAIERGDWDAVGRAAAMIGDQSVGSPSSEDFTALNRSIDSDIPKERDNLSGEDKARAEELDDMINVGDWSGVVSKALMFSASPAKKKSTSKITDEEEEALQQAELWMQIAEQKKAAGATDSGALDAAEWAIQRSLTQLKEADKKKPRTDPTSDQEDEV